ncbi:DUF2637 domain-containing protein [Streptomyces acidiscabies]|uniref:DUF2637 domain-containing protein n=1 Tax=Streptomyces acidiscabies TaxID=42234 RepID=A0A0L0KJ54_9ACTN|nr:DUF2637 domain-containing protein [Streptomyces acidiscabies]KND38297.1 hypothetical protein IQ63_08025 [Streptomyces acidiscabies]
MSIDSAPTTAHITAWDRAVVIALGGAGCALSYDALQQMAVAIHVRGFLCWVFPLVIDGFIAYGVRALLVLRDAPIRARAYVWLLFGTATTASIWANALHAVRLNQQSNPGSGLRLGDTVVAVLSTLAPLALAGAVHLYILIARGPVDENVRRDRDDAGHSGHLGQPERIAVTRTDRAGQHPQQLGQVSAGGSVTALTDRARLPLTKRRPDTRTPAGDNTSADSTGPDTDHRDRAAESADLVGHLDTGSADSPRPAGAEAATGHQDSLPPVSGRRATLGPVTDRDTRTASDRQPDPDTEELLEIARTAVSAEGKLTRKVVAQAVRGQQIPLSNDRLTDLMLHLREQPGQPVTASRT